jgi:hypothetical protein
LVQTWEEGIECPPPTIHKSTGLVFDKIYVPPPFPGGA